MNRMKRDLQAVMDRSIANGEMPCASAAVYHRGKRAFTYACGMQDIGRGFPLREDSLFRLFSLTKPMTGATAMALLERGMLDLLTPVSAFLPGFKGQRVVQGEALVLARREATVRDLLSMTSGLVYPGAEGIAQREMAALFDEATALEADGRQMDTYALANRMGALPLAFHPGGAWAYGTSADVLGAVLEVAAGKKLDVLMRELLFEPLNMPDTAFYVPAEKAGRLATLYQRTPEGLAPFIRNHLAMNDFLSPPAFCSGGAGLVSTLEDVLHFGQMLLNGGTYGNARVLSPQSVAYMRESQLSPAQLAYVDWDTMQGYGYSCFMRILKEPSRGFSLGSRGEFGWDGWTGPYLTVAPAEELVLVLMLQKTDSGITELTRRVRNVVYANL